MSLTAFCTFISPRAQKIARSTSSTDLDVRGSIHLEKMLMLEEEINGHQPPVTGKFRYAIARQISDVPQVVVSIKDDGYCAWAHDMGNRLGLYSSGSESSRTEDGICIILTRVISFSERFNNGWRSPSDQTFCKERSYLVTFHQPPVSTAVHPACKSMVHLRCRVQASSAICPLKQPSGTFKQSTCTEYGVGDQNSSTEYSSLPKNDPTKRKGKVQLQNQNGAQHFKRVSKNYLQKNRADTECLLKMKYKEVKGGIKRTMRSFRSKVNKAKETLSESFSKHEASKDDGDSFTSFIENERQCEEMNILESKCDRGGQFVSNRGYQGFRRNHSKPKLETGIQAKERELDQEMDCSDDPPSHQRDAFRRHEFQCDLDIDLILDRLDEVEVNVQRLEAKIPEELQCWRKLVQKYRYEDDVDTYLKKKKTDDEVQTNNSALENELFLGSGSSQESDSNSHDSEPAYIFRDSGLSGKEESTLPAKQMDLPLQPRHLNFRLQTDIEKAEKDGIKEKTTSTPITGHGIFQSPNRSGKPAIKVKNVTHFVMDKTEKESIDHRIHRRAQTENGFGTKTRVETHKEWPSNCNTRQKENKDTCHETVQHKYIVETEEGKGDLLMYKDDMEEHRERNDAFKQGLQIVLQNYAKGKLDYDASVRSVMHAGALSGETSEVDDVYRVKEKYTAVVTSPNPLASSTIRQDNAKFNTVNSNASPFSVTFRNDQSIFETSHCISFSKIALNSSSKINGGGTDSGNLHKIFISPNQNKSGQLHASNMETHVSKVSVDRERVCSEKVSLTHVTDLPVGQTYNSLSRDLHVMPVESKICRSDGILAGAAETYISKFYASKEYFESQSSESPGTAQSAYQKSKEYFESQSSESPGTAQSAYQKSKEYFEKINLDHIESNQGNIDKKGKDNHDGTSLKRQSSGGYGKPVMVISPRPGDDSQDKSSSLFGTTMGLQSLIEDLERNLPFRAPFQNSSSPRAEATRKTKQCNYADKDCKEQGKGVRDCNRHWSFESDKQNMDITLKMEIGSGQITSTKNKDDRSLAQSCAKSESNGVDCGFERSEREKTEIVPKRIPDEEEKFASADHVLFMIEPSVQAAKCELQESSKESEARFSERSVADKPPCPGKIEHKGSKRSQNVGIQATEFGAYRVKERLFNAKYHFLNSVGMVKICSPELNLISENLATQSNAILENSGTSEEILETELKTVSTNSRYLFRDNQDIEQKQSNLVEESDSNLCTDGSDEVESESDEMVDSNALQYSSVEGHREPQIDDKAPETDDDANHGELPNGWEITCKEGMISEDHNIVSSHYSAAKAIDSMEISFSSQDGIHKISANTKQEGELILEGDGMMQQVEVTPSEDENLSTKEMSQISESEQQSEDGWDDSQEAKEMAHLDQFNEILDQGLKSWDPVMQWVLNQQYDPHVPELQMMLPKNMDLSDNQAHFRNMSPTERGFQVPDMIPFQQGSIGPMFIPSPDIGGDNSGVNPTLEGCNKADITHDETVYYSM